MTLLPAQLNRLASLARQTNKAVGVSQDGSVLHIVTGTRKGTLKFDIDARGQNIDEHPNQEKLC